MIDATHEGLSEYEREIIAYRGDGRLKSDREMIQCCALGLAEEAAEVAYAIDGYCGDPLTELGDVLWYTATAAHRLGWTLQRVRDDIETNTSLSVYDEDEDYVRAMLRNTGSFAGLVKKWLYHDKPLDESLALNYLAEIVECADRVATQLGHTLDDARAANVAKLRKRFPSGGFTAAEANARADEATG